MIEVVRELKCKCPECGCAFTYELDDDGVPTVDEQRAGVGFACTGQIKYYAKCPHCGDVLWEDDIEDEEEEEI